LSTKPRTSRVGFVAVDAEGKASIWEASFDRRFAPRHLAPANAEGSPVFDNAGDLFFAAGAGQGQLRLSHQKKMEQVCRRRFQIPLSFSSAFLRTQDGWWFLPRSPEKRRLRSWPIRLEVEPRCAFATGGAGYAGRPMGSSSMCLFRPGRGTGQNSEKTKSPTKRSQFFDRQQSVRWSGRSWYRVRGTIGDHTRRAGDRSAICLARS
jgi:hypothetical protein